MNTNNELTTEFLSEGRNVHAYEPVKFFLMKCNAKKSGFKTTSFKFLVQAETYADAKEMTEDYVKKQLKSKVSITNITGNAINYEYFLKETEEKE